MRPILLSFILAYPTLLYTVLLYLSFPILSLLPAPNQSFFLGYIIPFYPVLYCLFFPVLHTHHSISFHPTLLYLLLLVPSYPSIYHSTYLNLSCFILLYRILFLSICKKGDGRHCNNYRELSLLSTHYKIFTNVLHKRLNRNAE